MGDDDTPASAASPERRYSSEGPSDEEEYDEGICAICLGSFNNMSKLRGCFHAFCFECICRWARVSLQCPLCKRPFRQALHSIENDSTFQIHEFADPPSTSAKPDPLAFPTARRQRMREWLRQPWGTSAARPEHSAAARAARARVYSLGLRAMHVGSNAHSRYRDYHVAMLRNNSAQRVRVSQWVQRELEVLLGDIDVDILVELVMGLAQQYHPRDERVTDALRPFLQDRTERFVHELVCFAQSPFGMDEYDRYVQYAQEGRRRSSSRDENPHRDRESRDRDRGRRRDRDASRDRRRDRDTSRSRDRDNSHDRSRNRDASRDRHTSHDRSRERSRDRDRHRDRDLSRDKRRDSDSSRDKRRDRDASRDKSRDRRDRRSASRESGRESDQDRHNIDRDRDEAAAAAPASGSMETPLAAQARLTELLQAELQKERAELLASELEKERQMLRRASCGPNE